MKTTVFFGLVLIMFATPAFGQLAPWWISDVGCQKGIGSEVDLTTVTALDPLRLQYFQPAQPDRGWLIEEYAFDNEGDLCQTRVETVMGMNDRYWRTWETPIKILDYPLDQGKTWTSESQYVEGSSLYTTTSSVVGPRIFDTILGPLNVIEVTVTSNWGSSSPLTRTLYLHDQLGNVKDLVSFSGCNLVSVEMAPWGSIKAQYR